MNIPYRVHDSGIELHEESLTKIKITNDLFMEYYEFHKLLNEKLEEFQKKRGKTIIKKKKEKKANSNCKYY
jgi:hypothetical protein